MSKYMHTLSPYDKRPCEVCIGFHYCRLTFQCCEADYLYACGRSWQDAKRIPKPEIYAKLFNMEETAA
jgi:hypothetical protein